MADPNILSSRANKIIGVLLIASFVLICVLAAVDNLTDVFDKDTYKVKAYYKNIGLLKTGAPVQIGGVVIGQVTEMKLLADERILVVAELYLRKPIPVDSLMGVNATAVSGDTYINLVRGDSDNDIQQTTDLTRAPVLRGLDFFSISNISMLAETTADLMQQTVDDVRLIFGRGRPTEVHATAIRNRIPQLKKDYEALVNHFRDNADLYKGASEGVQRLVKKTENTRNKVLAVFPLHVVDNIKLKMNAVTENTQQLQAEIDSRQDDIEQIKSSFSRISNWAETVKYSECSVVGVILRDDDCGAARTVSVLKESMQKVMDLSLISKLAYYIKARGIASDFFDSADVDELTPEQIYRLWAEHSYRQKRKFGAVCSGEVSGGE